MNLVEVSSYKTEYRKRKLNGVADGLSRLHPQNNNSEEGSNQTDGAMVAVTTRSQKRKREQMEEKGEEQQGQKEKKDKEPEKFTIEEWMEPGSLPKEGA